MTDTNSNPGTGGAGVQEESCSEKTERLLNKPPKSSRQVVFDTLAILRARFPNCFARPDRPRRQPLKIGIHLDIIAALPELPATDIARALRFYTGDIRYLKSCVEGRHRIGIDGQPTGTVTADEAEHCEKSLQGILAKRQKSRLQSQSPPDPAPDPAPRSTPEPRPKLTLAALRAAATKRKLETSGA